MARFSVETFLAKTALGRSVTTYRARDIICAQGDACDAVFYIQSGKVKVTVLSEQGKEAVIALLGADEFFGEGCLAGQPLRLATAVALDDVVAVRIDKATFISALHDEPSFSSFFTEHC